MICQVGSILVAQMVSSAAMCQLSSPSKWIYPCIQRAAVKVVDLWQQVHA